MKIVVLLPLNQADFILCFPLLHRLKEFLGVWDHERNNNPEIPKSEFHLVSEESLLPYLTLLPFNAFYHEFQMDDGKSFFTLHRFVGNSKLPSKPDYFLCLTKERIFSYIGFDLRAKKSFGFEEEHKRTWWLNLFFTTKITYSLNRNRSELMMEFLSYFNIKEGSARYFARTFKSPTVDFSIVSTNIDEEVIPVRKKILFFLDAKLIDLFLRDSILVDFLNLLKESHQLLFLFENNESSGFESILRRDKIPFVKLNSCAEATEYFPLADGIITSKVAEAFLATYQGKKVIWMTEKNELDILEPYYFSGRLYLISLIKAQKNDGEIFSVIEKCEEMIKVNF